MNLAIINFTFNGGLLNKTVSNKLEDRGHICTSFTLTKYAERLGFLEIGSSLRNWTENMFENKDGIIFIGASGIAIRAIAPFIKDKKTDPAIIVIDEKGKFIIPVLAGHIGGANKLAIEIAHDIGGEPVITTATDVNGKFAVDTFATDQNLYISDVSLVKKISGRILDGYKVGLLSDYEIKNKLPDELTTQEDEDVGICISLHEKKPFKVTLNLIPKIVSIGIGCRKNTPLENIESLVIDTLNENNISIHGVKSISSIDLKKEEEGLLSFSEKYGIPFKVYRAEELKSVQGDYSESQFVNKITGVSNVCERSAVIGCKNGRMIVRKIARNGVTIAVAVEDWSVEF